mmetsp:Transcript_3358/g.9796  ORF Transcript_3358/g.9796 Transcript_3358/m.9796 type:complete len:205 (-) Transcript_3358:2742-3356(-)
MLRNSAEVVHTSLFASTDVAMSSKNGRRRTKRSTSGSVWSSSGGACARTYLHTSTGSPLELSAKSTRGRVPSPKALRLLAVSDSRLQCVSSDGSSTSGSWATAALSVGRGGSTVTKSVMDAREAPATAVPAPACAAPSAPRAWSRVVRRALPARPMTAPCPPPGSCASPGWRCPRSMSGTWRSKVPSTRPSLITDASGISRLPR